MKTVFLIAACGSSSRFDHSLPKIYNNINPNKTVLRYVAEKVLSIKGIDFVRFIINKKHSHLYKKSVNGIDDARLLKPIIGGETRSMSVRNGLKSVEEINPDYVFIHDCARPLFNLKIIQKSMSLAKSSKEFHCCIPVFLVHEAIKNLNQKNGKIKSIDRSTLYKAQTPQMFNYNFLTNCLKNLDDIEHYDESEIIEKFGGKIETIDGSHENIKITFLSDLVMVQGILSKKNSKEKNNVSYKNHVGFGMDVHKFGEDGSAEFIRLLGVDVPCRKKLIGHSDADVAIHALIDAILGSIGERDIGHLFPDTDSKYKNIDSTILLKKVVKIAKDKNVIINNADITIVCEYPKIGPHADKMKKTIESILDFSNCCINVKATTTEKLGFTGRSEGILVNAVVSTCVPI